MKTYVEITTNLNWFKFNLVHKLVLIHSCILLFLLCQPGAIKKKSYMQFCYDSLIFTNENKFYIKWGKSRYLLLVILFSQLFEKKTKKLFSYIIKWSQCYQIMYIFKNCVNLHFTLY